MGDIPTIQLECKKDSIKQLQNGDGKLTLTVNAEDMNAAIASLWAAPMGTRYQVVMVEIGSDEQPVDRKPEPEQPKAKPPMTESQRCALYCSQGEFQKWMAAKFPKEWEFFFVGGNGPDDAAACIVRHYLKIASRRELDDEHKHVTRQAWQSIVAQFEADTGRMAERTR